ncbi:hypothetical protein HCB17_04455 [Salinispora arenicola]|nr:hypothetical protein [Salinispora arenicola]NIL40500.1 hypothetical protein [Salinispora arenicola]NIL60068.1 hypothetical protein [Salinispora arenicola]NIL64950.1 hypothetical protein [Salinispora arenicola]
MDTLNDPNPAGTIAGLAAERAALTRATAKADEPIKKRYTDRIALIDEQLKLRGHGSKTPPAGRQSPPRQRT